MPTIEILPGHTSDARSAVATLSALWGGAWARMTASYAQMEGAPRGVRLALDARAGDLIAEMGDIERVLEWQPAADLGDVLSKALIAVVVARDCAAPDELGPGWALVVSLLRDLVTMTPAIGALAGLTALGLNGPPAESGATA